MLHYSIEVSGRLIRCLEIYQADNTKCIIGNQTSMFDIGKNRHRARKTSDDFLGRRTIDLMLSIVLG